MRMIRMHICASLHFSDKISFFASFFHLILLSLFVPPTPNAFPISIRFDLLSTIFQSTILEILYFSSHKSNLASVAWRLKMMCSLSVALHRATHSVETSKKFLGIFYVEIKVHKTHIKQFKEISGDILCRN